MAPLNLYDVSIEPMIHFLNALKNVLNIASTTAESKGLSLPDLINARLAPDMYPLTFQVQSACKASVFIAANVGGAEAPAIEDKEETFDQLQDRITRTIEFLNTVKRESFEGKEEAEITFRDLKFSGLHAVTRFAMPNFYFHVTTTYAIFRNKGIDVGKRDYLGLPRQSS